MTESSSAFSHLREDRIERLPIFLMEQIIRRYRKMAVRSLHEAEAGISLDQWILLKQISENNGTSQVEIAQSTVKDAPTTTRIIDQLSQKNLIAKQLDPNDRRKYMVFVTLEGKQLIERLLPTVRAYRKIPFQTFSAEDKANLISLLERMDQNLM